MAEEVADGIPLIAIVDDDQMVAEATRDLVETFGFRARAFASGAEFLGSDAVSGSSCLIVDVQMPGMNGLQLHRRMMRSGRHVPVIFITAFPDDRIRQRALKAAGAFCGSEYRSSRSGIGIGRGRMRSS